MHLTNVPTTVALASCATSYRGNWGGERNDHRLKSAPLGIGPLFVRTDDQLTGKTPLLTLLAALVSWEITLTWLLGDDKTTTHLTPLPALLVDVLRYLHLPVTLYTALRDILTFDIPILGK